MLPLEYAGGAMAPLLYLLTIIREISLRLAPGSPHSGDSKNRRALSSEAHTEKWVTSFASLSKRSSW